MMQPIFQSIFGDNWHALPSVMQRHYSVRAGTNDRVVIQGWLDIRLSFAVRVFARLTGLLIPYEGTHVPVAVTLHTKSETGAFHFTRVFAYPHRRAIPFNSHMQPIDGNEVIEWMGWGIGWKCAFNWRDGKVILSHRGYVLRIGKRTVAFPGEWLLGKGYAEETPLDERRFAMWTHTMHPLFGETFRYGGEFEICESPCAL